MEEPELEFRAPRQDNDGRARTIEVHLTEDDKQNLADTVERIFHEEMLKSRYFKPARESEPDVLRIRIRFIDIVALAPREPDAIKDGMDASSIDSFFVSSVGEATLVGKFHDSVTGEILARVVERRAAGQSVGGVRGSRSSGWAEIVPGVQRWAKILREDLDDIHDL